MGTMTRAGYSDPLVTRRLTPPVLPLAVSVRPGPRPPAPAADLCASVVARSAGSESTPLSPLSLSSDPELRPRQNGTLESDA